MRDVERNGTLVEQGLAKCPTEVQGLDEITGGGLPRGRPTLVCGGAGSGKTILGMEFLVRGALRHLEPGVFMAFEETAEELTDNVRSLGLDLDELIRQRMLIVDHVWVDRSEVVETGEYDLEGLFIRLEQAIDTLGARRVVLDTIEALFGGLSNESVVRAEFRRLFRFLKEKGVTAIVTAERGGTTLTRHGLEEYVSDCVIALDHRVMDQVSTRRLRIVKYRGSTHGTNEYPFLISEHGISVVPVTSLRLQHEATMESVSTGIPRLDVMLGGRGFYRGSSVLVSGTAGTGKTSLAAQFADATCRRGERCLYFATEESQSEVFRNMRSIGIDLAPWIHEGVLRFQAGRPTATGLEMHLVSIHEQVQDFQPRVVILDPITDFVRVGTLSEGAEMALRLIDFLKARRITALVTNLVKGHDYPEHTELNVSALIDTWILLREIEMGGERNRTLYILKSRGMAHSNQLREFLLSDHGIELLDVYLGPDGVFAGSLRVNQESRERAEAVTRRQELERQMRIIERKRRAVESQVVAMRLDLESQEEEALAQIAVAEARDRARRQDEVRMAESRQADAGSCPPIEAEPSCRGGSP